MRSRAALLVFLSLVGAAGASACAAILGFDDTTLRDGDGSPGDDQLVPDQDGGADGHTLADGAPSRLTTDPSSIFVRRGGSATVGVDIERGGDIPGDVTIELTNLPSGVTATKAMLAADASTGSITLTASKMATLGDANLKLVADGTTLPASPIPLTVADPSGTIDLTFGTGGLVSDMSKGAASTFYALAVQSDGAIIAAGGGSPTLGWLVRRFSTAGAADTAFTTAQGAAVPIDGAVHAVGVDSKGNILCVGSSPPMANGIDQITVMRLTKTGALDSAFGTGGVVRAAATEAALGSEGLGLAIAADDSFVISGSRATAADTTGVLIRYKANGTRDAAFGMQGVVEIPSSRLVGVSLDATGVVYAGGTQTTGPQIIVTKRLATGGADNTFGTAGIAVVAQSQYEANGFAKLPSGDFGLVGDQSTAGYMVAQAAGASGATRFARLLTTAPGASLFGIAGVDNQTMVVAGHTAVPNGEARVEEVNASGLPVTTFGQQGIALIEDAGAGNGFNVTLFAAAAPGNRILAAGNRSNAGATIYRLWQ